MWKYLYSTASTREHATLNQIRNVVNRTNIASKPEKNFNACDDFFQLVTTCHILAASLQAFHMDSLEDLPSDSVLPDANSAWMMTTDERKKILNTLCEKVVDLFVSFAFSRHAVDQVMQYSTQVLRLGLFYQEFSDAIKEGDGDRVLKCWRYLLPIFCYSGRKNYSVESLNMLCQYHHGLPARQAQQLIWSRFVNVHGLPGKNIPADLHQEHLNRLLKEAVHGLGSNKTEQAITRIGKALGTLSPIMDRFDKENAVPESSGQHHPASLLKGRDLILCQLQQSEVFKSKGGQKHRTFPKPRDVLHAH